MEHLAELGSIDIGHQVVEQGDIERPAGRERLLQDGAAPADRPRRSCIRRPNPQLRLQHAPVHFEIIDDENAPPGDLRQPPRTSPSLRSL